jgi:hypothetical protein
VIFIDEIDTVRSLPFSTDEFFAGIRECYNRRTEDPAFEQLKRQRILSPDTEISGHTWIWPTSTQLPASTCLHARSERSTMLRTLEISLDVPDSTSEESLRVAERVAKEAALLALQQCGELTMGEAADELGLPYGGYLDLLAEKGLPATCDGTEPQVMEALRQQLRQRRQPTA